MTAGPSIAQKLAEHNERKRAAAERRRRYAGLHVVEFWIEDMGDQLADRRWPSAVWEKIAGGASARM